MGKEKCCSSFGERVCQFIIGESSMGIHRKLRAMLEERELESA